MPHFNLLVAEILCSSRLTGFPAFQEAVQSSDTLSGESKADMQLPREVIQQLRDVVFGFDTFYVTSAENYQANGVLFKGNLRGRSPAESYTRTAKRFQVTAHHSRMRCCGTYSMSRSRIWTAHSQRDIILVQKQCAS